jgi:quinolinate synthase
VLKSLEEGIYEISLAENELNGARASLERMMQVQ